MANITSAIRNILTSNTDITDVVSIRIYPVILPQNAVLPAITIQLLQSEVHDTLGGMAGLFEAEIQVDVYSLNKQEVQDIAENVRLSLQAYSGINLGVSIKGIHFLDEMDGFEPEVSYHRQISRFTVFYNRVNPDHS